MGSALVSYRRRRDVCSKLSVIREPRSLNDVPDEILLTILSHFGPEDLCLVIARVCERWNVLAKDMILWRTLSYTCDSSSDISRIGKVLTQAPALDLLFIRKRGDAARILEFLFRSRNDLRKLVLEYCWLGEDSTGLLDNIVALYPDLEGLSLHSCHPLTSAGYRVIPRLRKLSELDLSDCQGLSGKTVRLIADSCQHLKKFNLDGAAAILDDDVIHVVKKLGKQLTTLVLSGVKLTDIAFVYMNNCSRLQEVEVTCCKNMTERGLLEGIGSLHELTSLRLNKGHNLTAGPLSTFLLGPSMTSIVLLNLSECPNLDDEGLKGIAKRCIHLKEFTVCWCHNVTDAGISMVISHCNQLRVLDLTGLKYITGNGCLALVPSHLPHLRLLCLEDCDNVHDEYVEELVAAVPELKVIK